MGPISLKSWLQKNHIIRWNYCGQWLILLHVQCIYTYCVIQYISKPKTITQYCFWDVFLFINISICSVNGSLHPCDKTEDFKKKSQHTKKTHIWYLQITDDDESYKLQCCKCLCSVNIMDIIVNTNKKIKQPTFALLSLLYLGCHLHILKTSCRHTFTQIHIQ